MLDFKTIRAAAWGDETALSAVSAAVAEVLGTVPEGKSLGATKLMVAIADVEHFKLLANALYRLRQSEDFAGLWTRGARKGAFGHMLVVYLGQARTLGDVRRDIASTTNERALEILERELQARLAEEQF